MVKNVRSIKYSLIAVFVIPKNKILIEKIRQVGCYIIFFEICSLIMLHLSILCLLVIKLEMFYRNVMAIKFTRLKALINFVLM